MRKAFSTQRRFDCSSVEQVTLNCGCRDEIIPILAALQHVFANQSLRRSITSLVARDVNAMSRRDVGREGFDDWQIVVLAAVRVGCNLDYDKLQDLSENHRSLRGILGVGDWDDSTSFNWRRIRNTLCMLKPKTIKKVNQLIVAHGQQLVDGARDKVRADSFVVETDIHYPAESSLIWDGVRKIIPLCERLSAELGVSGWRQSKHLTKRIKERVRVISQISSSRSPKVKAALPGAYERLLQRVKNVLERAEILQIEAAKHGSNPQVLLHSQELQGWIDLTNQVCGTAYRRVLLGETVPNTEKLFSLFETHTQLYRRGKASTPNQFGRLIMVFEDAAGFISHYHLMHRDAQDKDVIVAQTRQAQKLHNGEITEASFDRGFYSTENEEQLSNIVSHVCVPPRHPKQYAERLSSASVQFRRARQRHPGIESAIGALQSGNGLKRCRDHSEVGLERYIGLAILGRNLQVLGKILIARHNSQAQAAMSKRKAA